MFDIEIIVVYLALYSTALAKQPIENAGTSELYNLPKYTDVYSFFSLSLFNYDIDLKLFLFSDILLLYH